MLDGQTLAIRTVRQSPPKKEEKKKKREKKQKSVP